MTENDPAGCAPTTHDTIAPRRNDSNSLIAERRRKLREHEAEVTRSSAIERLPEDDSDVWGLALSGGGIRSATFSFGLLRGLAKQKLLSRIDVLSTVSGGGYVGCMLGRLYDRERPDAQQIAKTPGSRATAAAQPAMDAPADRVEKAMADAESTWFGWWLRSNGRYLAPKGVSDRLFAITIYLRNLLALHFEYGLLAVLAGCGLAALDLGIWQSIATVGYTTPSPMLFDQLKVLSQWLPTAWLLLGVVLPVALHLVFTYWDSQKVAKKFRLYCVGKIFAACVLVMAAVLISDLTSSSTPEQNTVRLVDFLPSLAALVALLLITSAVHAALSWHYLAGKNEKLMARGAHAPDALTEMRNQLTHQLTWCVGISLVILGMGVVERLGWLLAFQTQTFETLDLGILLAIASGIAQALMLSIGGMHGQAPQPTGFASRIVPHLLRAIGYLLAAALLVWWVSLVLKVSFGAVFPHLTKSDGTLVDFIQPQFSAGWLALLCMFAPAALYVLATGSNLGFLNLSSLHTFYKARLVRSYLGATNNARFSGRGAYSALEKIDGHELTTRKIRNVGKVAPGDDVSLKDYSPHSVGGPVHIINTCANQTADPEGRLFNRDRKGLPCSVRAGGDSRLSQEGWRSEFPGIGKLSLGGWLAISGAAAAPGMGAATQSGLASLLTFAGVRLGYWLSTEERRGSENFDSSFVKRALSHAGSKSMSLLRELSATFGAGPKDNWYLSDGGHFDNTGVYSLLLEQASVIVVADCSADPGYSFEDVENLVRKARIDLDITITFRQPQAPAPRFWSDAQGAASTWRSSLSYFGTLQDLAGDQNESCLALATIDYPNRSAPTPAILILVKPNTFRSVSMDVANYKRQHPSFPQETTGDQFFSESQWESYFSLGTDLGQHLCPELFAQLRMNLRELFDLSPAQAPSLPDTAAAMTPSKPVINGKSRSVWGQQVGAVGATLGAGAVLSLGVAAWQSFESYRNTSSTRVAGERHAMMEIAQLLGSTATPHFAE